MCGVSTKISVHVQSMAATVVENGRKTFCFKLVLLLLWAKLLDSGTAHSKMESRHSTMLTRMSVADESHKQGLFRDSHVLV